MAQYTAVTVSPNLLKFADHDIGYGLFALAVKQGTIADQSIFGYLEGSCPFVPTIFCCVHSIALH